MNITVTGLTQHIDLQAGKVKNYLELTLPSGRVLKAEVDDETVVEVVRASKEAQATAAPSPSPPLEWKGPLGPPAQESLTVPTEQTISWAELPDDFLSVEMKAALYSVGAPAQMSGADLQQACEGIQTNFTKEDWNRALLHANMDLEPGVDEPEVAQIAYTAPEQVPTAPPQVPRAPPVGEVMWSDGSPVARPAPPIRTVQKDDNGYPIVSGVDPATLLGHEGSDEDGVQQI